MSAAVGTTGPQAADGPILVYDGDCGFCARSVQFVLQHDRRGIVRFAARDGDAGRALRERHALQAVESLGGAYPVVIRPIDEVVPGA